LCCRVVVVVVVVIVVFAVVVVVVAFVVGVVIVVVVVVVVAVVGFDVDVVAVCLCSCCSCYSDTVILTVNLLLSFTCLSLAPELRAALQAFFPTARSPLRGGPACVCVCV